MTGKRLSDEEINLLLNNYHEKNKELEKRVEILENELHKKEDDELTWALSQFRYKIKDNDEMKALAIIEKALGKRKSMLRAKIVGGKK